MNVRRCSQVVLNVVGLVSHLRQRCTSPDSEPGRWLLGETHGWAHMSMSSPVMRLRELLSSLRPVGSRPTQYTDTGNIESGQHCTRSACLKWAGGGGTAERSAKKQQSEVSRAPTLCVEDPLKRRVITIS
ncbi:hypothetical protein CEXT_78491 [Caerostris extrusa]|uniref:Uncharacterized protein n=1 Tax=Caerostris extrusa TaxID=172846 RepID=A0AAV4Y793_CAEEX|nr:hypothetical protein CEXT_78491 [Caerostris extrusa]